MCKQKEEEDNKFDITYFLVQDVQKKKKEDNKFDITCFLVQDEQTKKRRRKQV